MSGERRPPCDHGDVEFWFERPWQRTQFDAYWPPLEHAFTPMRVVHWKGWVVRLTLFAFLAALIGNVTEKDTWLDQWVMLSAVLWLVASAIAASHIRPHPDDPFDPWKGVGAWYRPKGAKPPYHYRSE